MVSFTVKLCLLLSANFWSELITGDRLSPQGYLRDQQGRSAETDSSRAPGALGGEQSRGRGDSHSLEAPQSPSLRPQRSRGQSGATAEPCVSNCPETEPEGLLRQDRKLPLYYMVPWSLHLSLERIAEMIMELGNEKVKYAWNGVMWVKMPCRYSANPIELTASGTTSRFCHRLSENSSK